MVVVVMLVAGDVVCVSRRGRLRGRGIGGVVQVMSLPHVRVILLDGAGMGEEAT